MKHQVHTDSVKHQPPPVNQGSLIEEYPPEKNRRSHYSHHRSKGVGITHHFDPNRVRTGNRSHKQLTSPQQSRKKSIFTSGHRYPRPGTSVKKQQPKAQSLQKRNLRKLGDLGRNDR